MKANRKYIENNESISAVIGVILMVAIIVAIASTVYVYVSGFAIDPSSQAENASVAVKNENRKIKITLTKAGHNIPDGGYSFAHSVTIRLNGTVMDETGISSSGWTVGGSLYIGDGTPTLDDSNSDVTYLTPDYYSITVDIGNTVIYDGSVKVI